MPFLARPLPIMHQLRSFGIVSGSGSGLDTAASPGREQGEEQRKSSLSKLPPSEDGLVCELIDYEGVFVAASRQIHANGVARHFEQWKRPTRYRRTAAKS